MLMNNEGVTSLAVVDNQRNVIGNISNVDVKVCFPFECIFKDISKDPFYSSSPNQVLHHSSRIHAYTSSPSFFPLAA